MPGQWRAGIKCEAKKRGDYIKPEVRTVEPLVPMGQIDIYSPKHKNFLKKKGISFSKETKWTQRRDETQEAAELT